MTFTKDYAVGFPGGDLNIQKQSWNFLGVHPGHSNGIMQLAGEWLESNIFDNHIKGPWKHLPVRFIMVMGTKLLTI